LRTGPRGSAVTEQVLKAEIEKAGAGAAANGSNAKPEDAVTVLAAGDSLTGHLVMAGSGQLLGTFSGEIECSGELVIGPAAQVSANIRTRNVVISGFVRGNVTAVGRLKITASGRLEGDARIGALVVQEGGVHHGAIHVHPEGLPVEPEIVVVESLVAEPAPARVQLQASVDRVKKFWGEFF
jgi:cytoskeletal protein CcmA (bactofilin family)